VSAFVQRYCVRMFGVHWWIYKTLATESTRLSLFSLDHLQTGLIKAEYIGCKYTIL
jgi:hypothetical protein